MAAKKSPPKQKQRFSRRTIILTVAALILVILAVISSVQSAQKQELERKDREKFTILEADMTKLQTQLNKSAGVGEWKLDKGCEKPGIKFYTGDAGYCRIDVKPTDANVNALLTDLKHSITKVASIDSEGYDKVAEENFIGFTFSVSKEKCDVYYKTKENSQEISGIDFSCGRPAMHMYFPER